MNFYRHTVTKRVRSTDAGSPLDRHEVVPLGPWEPIDEAEATADTQYVRNPGGRVESVFEVDAERLLKDPAWTKLTLEEAKAAAPELFGSGS